MPFGWFMTILGGLWPMCQGFMDCAPCIDDALVQHLPLLRGHTGADAPANRHG